MEILITNDDGYQAKGIRVLAEIMKKFGNVTVIAPKKHQSGMSMAVSLGLKQIAYRKLAEEGTDADGDGNHGSNASTASCYSGTLGAAQEAALNGIPAIGVSLSTLDPEADFSAVEKYFPDIFRMIMANLPERKGIYYNVNFPDIPADEIKGIRAGHQGSGRWIKEFYPWDPAIYARYGITPEMLGQKSEPECEDGETLYVMAGEYVDGQDNDFRSDHWLMKEGYISIVAHNIDTTDREEVSRLESSGFDSDFH